MAALTGQTKKPQFFENNMKFIQAKKTSYFGNFDSRHYEPLGGETLFSRSCICGPVPGGFSLHQRQVVVFMGRAVLLRAGCCWKGCVGNDVSLCCNTGDAREVISRPSLRLTQTPARTTVPGADGATETPQFTG